MNRKELEARLSRRCSRDEILAALRSAADDVDSELYLVGGSVRDTALGRPSDDVDLFATRGTGRLVRLLGERWGHRGFRFRKRGVTTWRFSVGARQVDLVDASRRSLAEELARRELTINAVAFGLTAGRISDPLSGLADLRAGRLRVPRPGVFREDPVRALRAARFLAEFPTFRLTRSTRDAAVAARRGLRRAAPERIRRELDRMLGSPAPHRGLEALDRLNLMDSVLPELAPMRDCVAGSGRPTVWQHTLDALAASAGPRRLPGATELAPEPDLRIVRWSLLFHDVSKPETLTMRDDGRPAFHGHEVLGSRRTDAVLRRLLFARAERRRVVRLILWHLRPGHLADAGAPERGLRRLVRDAGEDLPLLVMHAACDARASGGRDEPARWKRLRAVLRSLTALCAEARAVPLVRLLDGRDVMRALRCGPGPRVGEALEHLSERQAEGAVRTREEAIACLREFGESIRRRSREAP